MWLITAAVLNAYAESLRLADRGVWFVDLLDRIAHLGQVHGIINDASGHESKAIFHFREKKEQRGRSKPGMEKRSTGLGFELCADINSVHPLH